MGSWFIHGLRKIEERLCEHCLHVTESQVLGWVMGGSAPVHTYNMTEWRHLWPICTHMSQTGIQPSCVQMVKWKFVIVMCNDD